MIRNRDPHFEKGLKSKPFGNDVYTMSRPKTRRERILDKIRANNRYRENAEKFLKWRTSQRDNTENDVKIMIEHKHHDTILCFDSANNLCNTPERWKFMHGWSLEKVEKHLTDKKFTFHRM